MSALLDRLEELARAVGTDPIRPAVLTAADLRFQAAATPRVVLRLLAVARAAEAYRAAQKQEHDMYDLDDQNPLCGELSAKADEAAKTLDAALAALPASLDQAKAKNEGGGE